MSDALKRGSVEYAEWLADKLHNTNDYSKEAAVLLVKQAKEIAEMSKDAARYHAWVYRRSFSLRGPNFNAAVDAAMENTK